MFLSANVKKLSSLLKKPVTLSGLYRNYLIILFSVYAVFPILQLLSNGLLHTLWRDYFLSMLSIGFLVAILYHSRSKTPFDLSGVRSVLAPRVTSVSFLLLAFWMILSVLINGPVHDSIIGTEGFHTGLITSLLYIVIFFAATTIRKEKQQRIFLSLLLLSGTIISAVTVGRFYILPYEDYFSYMNSLAFAFRNGNHLGYFLLITAVLAAGCFLLVSKKRDILFLSVSLILSTAALILSDTLGSILAFGLTVLFLGIVLLLCHKMKPLRFLLLLLIILSVFLLLLLLPKGNILREMSFGNLFSLQDSIRASSDLSHADGDLGSGRMILWQTAVHCIKEKPIFGYGLAAMRTILTEASDGYNNTVHCEFLEYATNHGLPAMIFYIVAVMGVFFRGLRFRKTLSSIRLICLCCAFAYLVSSAFGVTTFYVTPFLFIFLGMGEVPTESAEQQQIPPKEG